MGNTCGYLAAALIPGRTTQDSGSNAKQIELMQYRSPVGLGPSGNTWPRWAPQLLQTTSVRRIP
jgi:hypothetical protein